MVNLFTMGESVELKKIAAAIEHDEATTEKIIHQFAGHKYEAERTEVFVLLSWKTLFSCARSGRCMTISFVFTKTAEEMCSDRCSAGDIINHCISSAGDKA